MKILMTILVLVITKTILYSQNGDPDILSEKLSYFSLGIGNYWQYNQQNFQATVGTSESYFSIEINVIEVLENGEEYYCLESSFGEVYFVRIDTITGIVYQYNPRFKIEYVMHDLFTETGDDYFGSGTYYSYPSYPSLLKQYCDSVSTVTLSGISTMVKNYSSPDLVGQGNMQYFAYAQNIGLINSFFDFNSGLSQTAIELIYAKINGIEYGEKHVTGIEENTEIPEKYLLSQNYPNPFNPTTAIEYSIPDVGTGRDLSLRTNVLLTVYDVLGREVATLVDEVQPPGNYKVSFDGSGLVSGIYYYRIRTHEFVETKKMVLIK